MLKLAIAVVAIPLAASTPRSSAVSCSPQPERADGRRRSRFTVAAWIVTFAFVEARGGGDRRRGPSMHRADDLAVDALRVDGARACFV
jgi:hypothetical protein